MKETKLEKKERVRIEKLPYKLPLKLSKILDGFKKEINSNQSAVFIVDGRSGMGKTTISTQIGSYMTKNFSLDNIHFTPETFLEAVSKAKKGSVLVFDKAMLLSGRAALSAINRMIDVAMSMIRSKNLCIIFNVNSIFDLDKSLVLFGTSLLLHCYIRGKFLAFFKGGDGMDRIKQLYLQGKEKYNYESPKANFNETFSEYFIDKEKYEAKKKNGVYNFLIGNNC